MRPPSVLREALLDAGAMALPVDCAGCGRPDRGLCDPCRRQLVPRLACAPVRGIGTLTVATRYEGVPRGVLLAYKGGRTPLAHALAPLLAAALADALGGADASVEICPVPSTRRAQRRRGFDPVTRLLRATGRPASRVLLPAAPHADQKALGRRERLANLHGTHRARRRLDGRAFLLVDDVVTTGATLREAARAIVEAGGRVVGAAAIASTPRSDGPESFLGRHPETRG